MQVVNRRRHKPTTRDVYIGRPSRFGNPYRIGPDGDRETVVQLYRQALTYLVEHDPAHPLVQAIAALSEDAVLVCWCAPLACHGISIVDMWHRLHQVSTGYDGTAPRSTAKTSVPEIAVPSPSAADQRT